MPAKKSAPPSPLRRKIDKFWVNLFLTPEGRPKSAKLLYSFCLSIVFMLVYGLCYWFLIDPLEHAFAEASPLLRNLLETILPGLAGSVLCCSLYFVFKDKGYMVFIYSWILLFALAALITLISVTDSENVGIMLQIFTQFVLTGLITGSAFSWYMYIRWQRKKEEETNAQN